MTEEERQAWINTFSTPDGKAVLTVILNQLGFFSEDPSLIKPELIAVANWMLAQLGCKTVKNITRYIDAIVDSVSLDDVRNQKGDDQS